MPGLENGRPIPLEGSNILDFRSRLERIEAAVEPLKAINFTLQQINETLIKIESIFNHIVDKGFFCLKWLGIGVFIIVMFAMGFKEIQEILK